MDKFRLLEEHDNPLKIDRDLIEIQKMIIYVGKQILKEITEIKQILTDNKDNKDNTVKEISDAEQQILNHLGNM